MKLLAALALAWLAAAFAPAQAAGEVRLQDLPREARETLALIKKGGPFPYAQDGKAFGNRERLLPKQPPGYYREYTVRTPDRRDRGARRIVAGGVAGAGMEFYYSEDHYRSFRRIIE